MDVANVRELVPSADMMARRRFPCCRTTTATRLPSGDDGGRLGQDAVGALPHFERLPVLNPPQPVAGPAGESDR